MREEDETGLVPESLNVSTTHRELLEKGICSYLLPGNKGFELVNMSYLSSASGFEKHVNPEILKVCSVS